MSILDFFKHNRKKYVSGQCWTSGSSGFQFPESKLDSLKEKKNLGIAFSGGGTRSAAATLGQLRALDMLNILPKVKYISAVSGGTWASGPYTFLQSGLSDAEFLGPYLEPDEIDVEDLTGISERSLAYVISESGITKEFFEEALKLSGDETYSRAVGDIFLGPFGLDSNSRFFTHDQVTLDAALKQNKKSNGGKYYLEAGDFYTARNSRPFFIAGGTILTDSDQDKIHLEMTSMYNGVHKHFPDLNIGGGYISNYCYDSRNPDSVSNSKFTAKLGKRRHQFTISDMIGTSGAAPHEILFNMPDVLKPISRSIGFPEYDVWSPAGKSGEIEDEVEYSHGDGGHLENLGIMPLLKRKVECIIVFANSKTPFNAEQDHIATSIRNLFIRHSSGFDKNIVFKDGQMHYDALKAEFKKHQENGDPLIHVGEYKVKKNEFYGVKPYDVKILWYHNNKVENWKKTLKNPKILQHRHFANFPHYNTFFQNPPKIIDLTKEQVGMLAHLSAWSVIRNSSTFLSL